MTYLPLFRRLQLSSYCSRQLRSIRHHHVQRARWKAASLKHPLKMICFCDVCHFCHSCLFVIDYLRLIYAFAVEIIIMTFKKSGPNWSSGKSLIFKVQNRRQIAGSLEKINVKRCRGELGIGPLRVMLFIGYTYLGSVITNDARCTRIKLNPGLSWKKLHSARIRLFSPANWT